jgi:Cu/Ag efflux protein CusF
MKRLAVLLVVAAALLAPSAALASGVVLKVQKAAHLVAVTNGKTKVSLVHSAAASRLKVGQRVAMKGRTLRNGTLAASSMRVIGRAHKVHFRGLLLKRSGTRIVLSAGGAIISVRRGAVRRTSSANDTAPAPGSTVDVTATVTSTDELDEDNVSTVSAATPGGAIEGKLTLGTGKITVVSDQMALVINVPSTFDLSKFANGDEVLAKFTQGADGLLTLTDLSGNDNVQEADNNDDGDNGDDNGDNGGNGNGGGGGGDDNGD